MTEDPDPTCSSSRCSCRPREAAPWGRRDFLKAIGLGAGLVASQSWQVMAGPFTGDDFEKLVPADKKLHPGWVKSLTARGQRTVYRGAELERIGMPVGGLCAGQLYLGGDGKLWLWDIFNQTRGTGAEHYAEPMRVASPLEQGFAVRISAAGKTQERLLDRTGWQEVSFIGEYPIGYVEYRDPGSPVEVSLEAFSPFIPLDTPDSSLPATILEFTLTNRSQSSVDVELSGWLENAVCRYSGPTRTGRRSNRLINNPKFLFLECRAEDLPLTQDTHRPDILFEDFEQDTYGDWITTGTAFGSGPLAVVNAPAYQGDLGARGKGLANSHASAPGGSVEEKDSAVGTLTSPPFTIERNFINFLIGGGSHPGKTCLNLLMGEEVVLSATGKNNNHLGPVSWPVSHWSGKSARLQIVDQESGGWGNVGVDEIVFSDRSGLPSGPLAEEADFGTLGLALLDPQRDDFGHAGLPEGRLAAATFDPPEKEGELAQCAFDRPLIGSLTRKVKLARGKSAKARFLVAWHMPNLKIGRLPPKRHYAGRFDSALAVAIYVAANFTRLSGQTRLWHDTWYDSTLPFWFLDRTFLNTSILATSTCYRFGDGRFYGWEGVGCCEGTCGHVWQYAHAVARLFPDLERLTREQVDFGLALQKDGAIHFRGEFNDIPAVDAQAGTILRALREHQASPDDAFLKRNWPQVKRATQWLIAKDGNRDGLIESNQHNTLDTDWYGPVAWLSGLYLGALLAAQTLALEVGDEEFAKACRAILETGREGLVERLFNGEYFQNQPDPKHLDAINSGSGCEIDQVMGQSWAFQVGLPRVLPQEQTLAALRALWRYNFTPDVGPYRKAYPPGRWYAMPGEAGLLMCTFPRPGWDYAQAKGKGPDWAAGYFNECMNGFEYQVAGHMIWEGMLTEGLAITRAVHDRYHASRRNPWNEIECGDHYARSMASYGVYLAACGYEYHGPKRQLGFSPRLTSSNAAGAADFFKCAFTTAEGWGVYQQSMDSQGGNRTPSWKCSVLLKWGQLRIRSLAVSVPPGFNPNTVRVRVKNRRVPGQFVRSGSRVTVTLSEEATIPANESIEVSLA